MAKLTRVSKHVLERLLDEYGVKWVRIGQWPYLPLSEIENKVPTLWKSLCASCQASRGQPRDGRNKDLGARKGSPGDPRSSR